MNNSTQLTVLFFFQTLYILKSFSHNSLKICDCLFSSHHGVFVLFGEVLFCGHMLGSAMKLFWINCCCKYKNKNFNVRAAQLFPSSMLLVVKALRMRASGVGKKKKSRLCVEC